MCQNHMVAYKLNDQTVPDKQSVLHNVDHLSACQAHHHPQDRLLIWHALVIQSKQLHG